MKIARKLLFWIPLFLYIIYTIFVWWSFLDSYNFTKENPDQSLSNLGMAVVLIYLVLIWFTALCFITTITSIIGLLITRKLKNKGIEKRKLPFILTMVLPILTEACTILLFTVLMNN